MNKLNVWSVALLLTGIGGSLIAAEGQANVAAETASSATSKGEATQPVAVAPVVEQPKTNPDIETARLLGRMVASEPFARWAVSKEEKAALGEGFLKGLETPVTREESEQHMVTIRGYYAKNMEAMEEKSKADNKEKMLSIQLPMDQEIQLSSGGNTTLAKLAEGKKAVLLDFWASWCGPCMELMPELKAKGEKLTPQGVVVVAMNTDEENPVEAAEKVKKKHGMTIPWLLEPNRVFSTLLNIDSIPRMILVTPDGKVHFNDHPSDPGLAVALKKLGAEL